MSTGNEFRVGLRAKQFSLAGMLSVVFASSVYFGFLRITDAYLTILFRADRSVISVNRWLPPLSIFISWFALWGVYRYWRLRPALRIHSAGPLFFTPIVLLMCVATVRHDSAASLLLDVFPDIAYGFFVGVLFGFPIVAIILFARFVRRR
jgi:hypothetical protein